MLLKKWEPFLKGISFRIVTDCIAFKLTLSKKKLNPRIARWALELQNYDFDAVHRRGEQMGHVDGLSRNVNVVVATTTVDEIDFNLQLTQARDTVVMDLRDKLENGPVEHFVLENGLVYRQLSDGQLLFYVPSEMERNVIQK